MKNTSDVTCFDVRTYNYTRELCSVTCKNCRCHFIYEKEILINGAWKEYVNCPQCGCKVVMKGEE